MWMWSSDPSMIPVVSICISTSPLKVLMWRSWRQMSLRGGPSSGSCLKRYGRWRYWELIVSCFDHLLEAHAHMSSFMANISSLAKIANPETLQHGHEGSSLTDDSGQHPRALPESGPRSTPEDHHRRTPVPAGKSHPPLALISCTGTMVWTHQASSCSGLAPSQMQVFQWWDHQGGLHYI